MSPIVLLFMSILYLNNGENDRFKDVKLLCIGCSKGVGRATAKLILNQSGSVVPCSRSLNNLNWTEEYDNAYATICDVTNPLHYNQSVSFALDKMGTINAVFYVPTYIWSGIHPFETSTVEEILQMSRKFYEFDFEGPIRAIKSTLPVLKANDGGSFLALSSIASKIYSVRRGFAYGAMKRALEYLIQNSAHLFGEYNIRFNIARMGVVSSNVWDGIPQEMIQYIFDDASYRQPIQRVGTVEDCAYLFAFLLSNESKFITGAIMDIDGGAMLSSGYDGGVPTEFVPAESVRDSWIKLQKNPKVFKAFQESRSSQPDNPSKTDL